MSAGSDVSADVVTDQALIMYSTPWCGYCRRLKAQLDRAITETAAEMGASLFDTNWRIFQLNPDMPAEGMDRRRYLEANFGGPERAREIYARVEAAAADAGIEMHLDRIARTPNTMDASAAAPSVASDSTKQLASLANRTGRSRSFGRSRASGVPFNHVELEFLTSPVAEEIVPGIPTPTVATVPTSPSIAATKPVTARTVST